jgi:hypothetical protein
MRKPGGYTVLVDGNGKTHEGDAFTCKHCQYITLVAARQRPEDLGGFCSICASLICSKCVGRGCDPFEEKRRRMEAKHDALRSYGLV